MVDTHELFLLLTLKFMFLLAWTYHVKRHYQAIYVRKAVLKGKPWENQDSVSVSTSEAQLQIGINVCFQDSLSWVVNNKSWLFEKIPYIPFELS